VKNKGTNAKNSAFNAGSCKGAEQELLNVCLGGVLMLRKQKPRTFDVTSFEKDLDKVFDESISFDVGS